MEVEGTEGGGDAPNDAGADALAMIESLISDAEQPNGAVGADDAKLPQPDAADDQAKLEAAKLEPKPAEPPKPADAGTERALARLAAREAAIAEKEKAVEEASRKSAAVASMLRRGQVKDALTAIGLDENEIGKVVRVAYASQLPADKVPDAFRKMQGELELDDRIRAIQAENQALKAQLDSRFQEEAHRRAVEQYQASVSSFFTKEDAAAEVPLVVKMFQSAPDKARQRIMAVVAADAAQKAAKVKAGELDYAEPMTPAEAAKAVEAELSEYAQWLGNPTNNTPAATTVAKKPSLSNRAVQPARKQEQPKSNVDDITADVESWLRTNNLV